MRRRAHFLRNWWLEIGARFVFVLAWIAIVVTLRPHQGGPLPQWSYNISVNSLRSIYVVVLKATVLLATAESLGKARKGFETKSFGNAVVLDMLESLRNEKGIASNMEFCSTPYRMQCPKITSGFLSGSCWGLMRTPRSISVSSNGGVSKRPVSS